jgi:hypothetical protein
MKETTSKTHMQEGANWEKCKNLAREEWGRTGPKRPWADRPSRIGLGPFLPGAGSPLT